MKQALAQVPNYTCLETIRRYSSQPGEESLRLLDTVLVEVSYVGGKELLAWPGERSFTDSDLEEFGAGGLMGGGLFTDRVRAMLADFTTIRYSGPAEIGGRPLARYDFRQPAAWSGYLIHANGTVVTVNNEGSFWIDPGSLELARMEHRAAGIPDVLGIRSDGAAIDYAGMRLGSNDVLLPQSARQITMLISGEIRRNDIEFSHCREYVSESRITFDAPATQPQEPLTAVQAVNLPAGLTVVIELQSDVDSGTAHIGDPLDGRVADAVKFKGKVLVPKGAAVAGRIRGFTHVRSPVTGIELTIELAELRWENTRAEFYGDLVEYGGSRWQKDSGIAPVTVFGEIRTTDSSLSTSRNYATKAPPIPGTAVLFMEGSHFRITPGFKTTWRTLQPNARRKK